jgi:hypothetical protein
MFYFYLPFILELVFNFMNIYFYHIIKLKKIVNPIEFITQVVRGPESI